jgi:acetylornithine deacetylase
MVTVTREDVATTLAELVKIDSVNPSLVPGAAGETEIAAAIAARLRRTPGIEVQLQEVEPGRSNVIATYRGGPGRTLMLNGHTDTVGVTGMDDPFSGRIEGDKLHGRGSSDMKDGLAAAIVVLEKAAQAGNFPGTLIGTFVLDEEYASIGTEAICKEIDRWRPDACLVLEGTNFNIDIISKGYFAAEIETFGVAAHGSDYENGVDAIAHMGRVIVAIEELGRDMLARPGHPELGPSSIHLSVINGGREINTYPDYCIMQLECRTMPGHSAEAVEAELQAVLDRLAAEDPTLKANLRVHFARNPLNVDPQSELVTLVSRIVERERGVKPVLSGGAGWADAAMFNEYGVPAVIWGPGGEDAHGPNEYCDLATLEEFTRILYITAEEFCRGSTQ